MYRNSFLLCDISYQLIIIVCNIDFIFNLSYSAFQSIDGNIEYASIAAFRMFFKISRLTDINLSDLVIVVLADQIVNARTIDARKLLCF